MPTTETNSKVPVQFLKEIKVPFANELIILDPFHTGRGSDSFWLKLIYSRYGFDFPSHSSDNTTIWELTAYLIYWQGILHNITTEQGDLFKREVWCYIDEYGVYVYHMLCLQEAAVWETHKTAFEDIACCASLEMISWVGLLLSSMATLRCCVPNGRIQGLITEELKWKTFCLPLLLVMHGQWRQSGGNAASCPCILD